MSYGNTIIMDRVDHLGFSAMHSVAAVSGSVSHQAYAYLLNLTQNALTGRGKALRLAIDITWRLGAGFALAHTI